MKGLWLFVSGFFGIGFIALTIITLLPASASKPNKIGYYGVCSYAPISTVILFLFSAIFLLLSYKAFKNLRHSEMTKIMLKNETNNA
jgi:hypothetical protein